MSNIKLTHCPPTCPHPYRRTLPSTRRSSSLPPSSISSSFPPADSSPSLEESFTLETLSFPLLEFGLFPRRLLLLFHCPLLQESFALNSISFPFLNSAFFLAASCIPLRRLLPSSSLSSSLRHRRRLCHRRRAIVARRHHRRRSIPLRRPLPSSLSLSYAAIVVAIIVISRRPSRRCHHLQLCCLSHRCH